MPLTPPSFIFSDRPTALKLYTGLDSQEVLLLCITEVNFFVTQKFHVY